MREGRDHGLKRFTDSTKFQCVGRPPDFILGRGCIEDYIGATFPPDSMQQQKQVRTYLDPDAVGPLPRSALADDSDQLSAARTILRLPESATQEISADDVIEIVDPHRRNTSIAPVGYDTAIVAPRRRLGGFVAVAVGLACAVLVGASLTSRPHADEAAPRAAAVVPALRASDVAPPVPVAVQPTAAPASTIGTLRVDPTAVPQRVYVDGVALSAPAALLRCGPHDVGIGSAARTRTIDVPCGGEITVFR